MASVRSLLERLPLPAGCTDARGRVRWVNAAAARLHGSTPAKLVGADIRSLWPHAPVPRPTKPETKVEHAVIGGRSVWLRVTRLPIGRHVVAVSEEMTLAVELRARDLLGRSLMPPRTRQALRDLIAGALPHPLRSRVAEALVDTGRPRGR